MLTSPTPIPPRRRRGPSRSPTPNRRNNMHVEWYGQSSFALRAGDTTVFIDPFGDMSPAASRGSAVRLPADHRRRCPRPAGHPRASRSQRRRGDQRLAGRPALDGGPSRVPDRRGARRRLRTRRRGRDRARTQHDLRLRPRRRPGLPLRRFRSGRVAARSRPRRSARSTCCSSRSGTGRRSAPPPPSISRSASAPGGSSRCTTGPSAPTSWSRPTRSST